MNPFCRWRRNAAQAATVSLVLVALASGTAPAPASAADSTGSASGPALSVPDGLLAEALSCPDGLDGLGPVLLVHGTFATPEENWSWNYQRTLPLSGYAVCTVALPDRALADIQVASEYVVYAVRTMAARTGRQVDIIGHSQGGLEPRWAVRFWPDVRAAVDDLVTIAAPHHGTISADAICAPFGCPPAGLQMRRGSAFLAALNAGDETPGNISYTSVFTRMDELVQPAVPGDETAALDGAVNVAVQDLCPGKVVTHISALFDITTYNVILDALQNPGPADVNRLDAGCIGFPFVSTTDPLGILQGPSFGLGAVSGSLTHPRSTTEPESAPYAR
ncbi:MAG: esterase/lipase family protein [Acidimicrobiia bacterium]